MTSVVRLLQALIAIPSVNPRFLPADDPRGGEAQVAGFVAATAASAGLDVELSPVLPGRSNVLARLTPQGKVRHRLILAPHLDTVGATQVTPQLFAPRVKRGRVHGRGACDTKGSVAAMLSALCAVSSRGARPRETEVLFVGLVDEEQEQAGSRAFARNAPQADLAIVGEPTCNRVVTAHKGDVWLELTTRGVAAHGATPDLGRNAVQAMASIVTLLQTDYAEQLRNRAHPLLGHATINVGTIRGGVQPNVVPAECAITIDRRMLPGETEASVRREIMRLLRARGLAAEMTSARSAACPALQTPERLPWLQQLFRLCGQSQPLGAHYFCDAAVLAAGGIPSVVFGPGDIAQAHTADEWVEIRSLEEATRLLTRFLRSRP